MTTDDDHPEPPEDEEEDDLSAEEEPIEEDVPCIRCAYNLRGLKADGRCPECGARISATLRYVMQTVLCPVCMRPNQAMAAICVHCNSPVSGAAATGSYWKPTAISGGRKASQVEEDEEEETEAPSAGWMVMCWLLGGFFLACWIGFTAPGWEGALTQPLESSNDLLMRLLVFLGLGVGSLVPLSVVIFPTRGYLRARRANRARLAAPPAKEGLAGKGVFDEGKGE